MKPLVVGLAVLLFIGGCNQPGSFSPQEETGLQMAQNVSIFESKSSQQQWILTAEAVDFADLTSATLKNPVLVLKQDGKDSARVSGNSGSFNYAKKQVAIRGNARIYSLTQQLLITTERFFYDVNKGRIWSDVKTTVTRGDAKAVARGGIETDSKLAKIELKQQTTRLPQEVGELKKPL